MSLALGQVVRVELARFIMTPPSTSLMRSGLPLIEIDGKSCALSSDEKLPGLPNRPLTRSVKTPSTHTMTTMEVVRDSA